MRMCDMKEEERIIREEPGKARLSRRNLVLIGMPGVGKSTCGRLAAEKLGRRFVSLDREIALAAGRSIPEIFRTEGEEAFRDMESAICRAAAKEKGIVIAAGGGTVLRAENTASLKENGVLILLERPVSSLVPTADRPTADTREKIERLYRERKEIYREAADASVALTGRPEEDIRRILGAFAAAAAG